MDKNLVQDEFDTDEEQFETRDTYFLRGMLSGILLCVLFGAILFSVIYFWKNADHHSSGGVALDYDKVSDKLELLEQYVNQVYLNDADASKLEAGIYGGYIAALGDKYSDYYTADEYKQMMESTEGQYYGIGVYYYQDKNTKNITFKKPFPNGPAEKAGIQKNDILVSVNGEAIAGREVSDVMSHLKGAKDTVVKIGVKRGNNDDVVDLEVKLDQVEVPTVFHEMLADKIGYVQVTNFEKVTPTQFRSAIDELVKKDMKGLVIDLRGNPGGLLSSVTDMLDRLIKEGTLVYTKDKNGEGETFAASNKESLDVPMAVLINGGSASASELFSGAVQDYGIATIVGTTSYGKGVVQNIYPLKDGSAVKLTVSKYYTPKGRNIQGTGIEPDVKVELDEKLKDKDSDEIKHEEDNQLQAAIDVVKNKIK